MDTHEAKIRYHGEGGSLFLLLLTNALLTVITLGVYSFWARNKVRQFHYSHTEMDGDRFAYHGTGGELFMGTLRAFTVLFGVVFALGIVSVVVGVARPNPMAQGGVTAAMYAIFTLLGILAVNAARRYRLSRSSWRGIRFSFHGRFLEYLGLILKGGLLTVVTLGFYSPFFANERRAFFVRNARFGSEPFLYTGEGRALFWPFTKSVLLTLPTLGVCWIWYAAFLHRYSWNHTRMRGARFESSVQGADLLLLSLTNVAIAVLTLGIGAPWVITRTHSFWCDRLKLVGTVEWATIQQRAQTVTGTGEGLAESLDVDVDIGM